MSDNSQNLPDDDPDAIWSAFLSRLEGLVAQLKIQMNRSGVEISELLSPDGGAYVQIKSDRRRVAPGRYAMREFGPADFEAVGRLLVDIVERLSGFQHSFDSLASANAFWKGLVESVQAIDSQLWLRESYGKERARLPWLDFESFATQVMDAGLEEFPGNDKIPEQDSLAIATFVQRLLPEYPRALLVQADYAETHENYSQAIALYERAAEILWSSVSRRLDDEVDKESRSAVVHYTSEGREYAMSQRGLANSLARSGDLKQAIRVCQKAAQLQPYHNIAEEELLMTLMLEAGDKRIEKVLEESLYYIDPETRKRERAKASTVYFYTRAAWLWCSEGATESAKDALRQAFHHNPYVPDLFEKCVGLPVKDFPPLLPFTPGSAEDACNFLNLALPSWRAMPGLVEWLLEQSIASSATRKVNWFRKQEGKSAAGSGSKRRSQKS